MDDPWRKLAHVQKPSTQISNAFHKHGVVENKNDLAINALGIANWMA